MEQCTISKYLCDFNTQSKRGKCKACGKLIMWSRIKLSQHKRSSCPNATVEDKCFFSKRPTKKVQDESETSNKIPRQSPEISLNKREERNSGKKVSKSTSSDASWKISNYLENFDSVTGKGTCKSCQKSVQWSRAKIESHLRNSCLKNSKSPKIINKTQLSKQMKVLKSAALKTSCYICNSPTEASSTRLVQSLEFTKSVLFEVLGKKN